jgi:flagellar protein FliJ
MEQSMHGQRELRIDLALQRSSTLERHPDDRDQNFYRNRKDGDRLNRQRELAIETTRRRVAQIESMIADFDRMADAIGGDIQAEEQRTRIHDQANFAYSTFARALIQRRDNLNRSISELKRQLTDARAALETATPEKIRFWA